MHTIRHPFQFFDFGTRRDVEGIALGAHRDVAPMEMEDPQEVDEVALEERLGAEIVELCLGIGERAQMIELLLDLGLQAR